MTATNASVSPKSSPYILFEFLYSAGIPAHEFHLATDRRAFRAARDRQLHALSRLPGARRRLLRLGRRGQSLSRLLPRLGLRPARPLPIARRRRRSEAGGR